MSYTNSSLVNYTKLSPNHSGQRNHAIDTITIHCYVGQVTVENAGALFADPSRQASCNYVVAKDGKIGLIVEEKNRSWCSSSSSNDHRAITIEVASDATAPYAVNAKAYNALIELCADICKRNGIKKLLWKGDKSLIGQVSKQNMTVHRWFANKSCPGDYLYNRHGDIANKVNAKLGVKKTQTSTSTAATPSTTTTTKKKDLGKVNITMQAYTTKWWPAVVNETDWVGQADNKPIKYFAVKVDKGTITGRVYTQKSGWLPALTFGNKYNLNDLNNGVLGDGSPIQAIQLYYNTPAGYEYQEVCYCVSDVNHTSFYPYQVDNQKGNGMDGYAGVLGVNIDKIKARIE